MARAFGDDERSAFWGVVRSLPEEDLRDIVHRYFVHLGLRSDIVHGSTEHGKDVVAVIPPDKDVLGTSQTLLVQIKSGDINLSRWRREIKPQFDALADSFVAHLSVDEKSPKRYVLAFNGRLTEHAMEELRRYNEKRDVPIEIIDLARLIQMLESSGLAFELMRISGETLNTDDISNANVILGYLLGAQQDGFSSLQATHSVRIGKSEGLALSELVHRFPSMGEAEISRAVDILVDSGMIVPTHRFNQDGAIRSYRTGEMAMRAFSPSSETEPAGLLKELRREICNTRDFLKEVIAQVKPDVVVVQRKAGRLLANLLDDVRPECPQLVDVELLDYLADGDLRKKSVLIFDDVVHSGSTMASLVRDLQKHDAHVSLACLLINRGTFVQGLPLPTFMKACPDERSYVSEMSKLGLLLSSCNIPYEPGRPVLRFDWSGAKWPQIREHLRQVGNLLKIRDFDSPIVGSIYILDQLTIPNYFPRQLPDFASLESPCKMRIVFQSPSVLHVVPIVLPRIATPSATQMNRCRALTEWEFPLCKRLLTQNLHSGAGKCCLMCTTLHEGVNLGRTFMNYLLKSDDAKEQESIDAKLLIDQCEAFFGQEAQSARRLFELSDTS